MTCHVESFSNKSKQLFLQRLFDAFDENHNDSIDFREYIKGLTIILKGNTDEKMECMSFIYLFIILYKYIFILIKLIIKKKKKKKIKK